ncbi:MAG: hypothetical protein ACRCT1_20230 [Microcoleaceae cyanobacterium]
MVSSTENNGKIAALLSQLGKQTVNEQDITPSLAFLSALVMVAMGAMLADGKIAQTEEKLLEQTIRAMLPPDRGERRVIQPMMERLSESSIYPPLSQWIFLLEYLPKPQQTFILNFAYEMMGVDGNMDAAERKYLQLIVETLNIDPRHAAIMEAKVTGEPISDSQAWKELQQLLHQDQFEALGMRFLSLDALSLLSELTATHLSQVTTQPIFVLLAVTILLSVGVMGADRELEPDEEHLLGKNLQKLLPPGSDNRKAIEALVTQVTSDISKCEPSKWSVLVPSLWESEKLLALCFAYEMSVADGELEPEEKDYLLKAAEVMKIDPCYSTVLEANFGGESNEDEKTWQDLQEKLRPTQFQHLDWTIQEAANRMLDELELLSL